MKKFLAATICAFGFATLAGPASAVVIIDDFSDAQEANDPIDGADGPVSNQSAPGAIGGFRDLIASNQTGGTVTGRVTVAVNEFGNSFLQYSEGPGQIGTGTVIWDGSSGSDSLVPTDPNGVDTSPGLGGEDLTAGGLNTGLVLRINADKAYTLMIKLWDTAGNEATQTQNITQSPNTGSFERYGFYFGDFAGGSVDFADISAIGMEIQGVGELQTRMSFVKATVVPLPASALLLLGGLGGLGFLGWRRKSVAA